MGVFYVVENGGFSDPDTGIGHIEPVPLNEAFECDAHFFVVSPPKDEAGKSTRYITMQRALASIGVEYKYHMRAVSCATFCTTILCPSDDSFRPIQACIVRSHKNNQSNNKAAEQLENNKKKYKLFQEDLCNQMKQVPDNIILTLRFYLKQNERNRQAAPWFKEMVRSYKEFFAACSRYQSLKL